MIQKNVTTAAGNALSAGLVTGNTFGVGEAVNKKEATLGLETLHQPLHRLGIAGQ
jgi:hypothetical protein